MNLDEAQKQQVAAWIEAGLKLSDIQRKLVSEFGLNLTYMEARFLVDDLKLMPKDQPRPQAAGQLSQQPPAEGSPLPEPGTTEAPFPEELPGAEGSPPSPGTGAVSVSVDCVARLGALVSGSVTFSDGNSGAWHLDQMGRLGIVPKQAGYRPSPADVQTFQLQLQGELAKLGF